MVATINPDASHIWDEAEVYILPKAELAGSPIEGSAFEPTSVNQDFTALGWQFVGLIDAAKGIPVSPSGEFKQYDAFGFAAYRSKFTKGKLDTGFTCLEDNAVTAGIVLPGSTSSKIGVPRDLQYYVLYRTVDTGLSDIARMSLRPALLELTSHSGAIEGEQEMYEFAVHHSPDSNKDVFLTIGDVDSAEWTVTVMGSPTGGTFTLTYQGKTTAGIAYNAAGSAVKSALVALDDGYSASDFTVTGAGPYAVTVPVAAALAGSGAGLTGGSTPSVQVAAA